MHTDKLTRKLREIEEEIDLYYKSNPLVNLPFAMTAWSFLVFAEDWMLKQTFRSLTSQEYEAIADDLINQLKDPMCWLYNACNPGGQVPFAYSADIHKASWDLFKLAGEYRWFVFAYTYFSRKRLKLDLQEATIQPTEDFFIDIEYNAYNRLVKSHQSEEASSSVNLDNLPRDAIKRFLRIDGERFYYKLNPRMVSDTIAVRKPIVDRMFSLPSEWQLSRYTLEDFRKVYEAISAMASIHQIAREIAASRGCVRMGYIDSICVCRIDDLLRQVVRYSGVSEPEVRSIFDDLCYGNNDISHPDPALQPLIKLNAETCAIMPYLWLLSSAERNLTVLLNRLYSEKDIYSRLTNEKEILMRKRLIDRLCDKGFRFICVSVPGLPDIDLAIIMDSEKTCLLLELKWFIGPDEAREVIEKSEEIEKGISQVLKLKRAFANNHELLLEKLEIDSSYSLEGAVVSENWIGNADVQCSEIPVIQADHLIEKLKVSASLEVVMDWLRTRKYLPKEEEDFKVHITTHTIGDWSLKWYKIQPLSDGTFPL